MGDVIGLNVREVSTGGEAGTTYNVTCPECDETVLCAEMGWWPQVCACGYDWSVTEIIEAMGSKWDEETAP